MSPLQRREDHNSDKPHKNPPLCDSHVDLSSLVFQGQGQFRPLLVRSLLGGTSSRTCSTQMKPFMPVESPCGTPLTDACGAFLPVSFAVFA